MKRATKNVCASVGWIRALDWTWARAEGLAGRCYAMDHPFELDDLLTFGLRDENVCEHLLHKALDLVAVGKERR